MYTSISIYAKYIVLLSLRITTIIIKISIHIYIYFREIIIKINIAIMIKKCQIYIYMYMSCRGMGREGRMGGVKGEGETVGKRKGY